MRKTPPFNSNVFRFKETKHRWSLTLIFSLVVFLVLLSAIGLAATAVYMMVKVGLIADLEDDLKVGYVILFMSVISLVIGSVIVFFTSKIPLRPINNMINKMNRLAAGDFQARLAFGNLLDSHPAFNEISTSFNRMAEELENTEVLRSDFINHFSHEFKTPIVSIAGLAKVLKKGNLSDEQREQYLSAIEAESLRLASMATNVLNLTKVENQTILNDITRYNLSEQIRSAILLLENKWTKKNIEFQLDFDEYEIEANEELLKQVWINLLDNAVKFVPGCGVISVAINTRNDHISVSIGNTGSEIPPEKQEKIWNKFYQVDESHATEGNGIGLAIVKRVVDLHGGDVSVHSGNSMTIFTVELPLIHP